MIIPVCVVSCFMFYSSVLHFCLRVFCFIALCCVFEWIQNNVHVSIAGVPFESVRRFRAFLLLRTTRMHSQRIGGVSGVAVINKQTNKTNFPILMGVYCQGFISTKQTNTTKQTNIIASRRGTLCCGLWRDLYWACHRSRDANQPVNL